VNTVKKLVIVTLFISSFTAGFSLEEIDIFQQASKHYKNREYAAARDLFTRLQNQGYENFEINYNLGCTYYKLGEIGKARYYFERALFFKPFDKDLDHNLKVLYKQIMSNPLIGEQEIMNKRIIFFVPSLLIVILFSITFLLVSGSVILFFISKKKRRVFLIIFIISFFFSTVSSLLFYMQKTDYSRKRFYVTVYAANIHLAPDEDEAVLISIPEGTRGRIINESGDFLRVSLPDGTLGWLKSSDVYR
jgi:tetratricopeptide (TPR) repeat protein